MRWRWFLSINTHPPHIQMLSWLSPALTAFFQTILLIYNLSLLFSPFPFLSPLSPLPPLLLILSPPLFSQFLSFSLFNIHFMAWCIGRKAEMERQSIPFCFNAKIKKKMNSKYLFLQRLKTIFTYSWGRAGSGDVVKYGWERATSAVSLSFGLRERSFSKRSIAWSLIILCVCVYARVCLRVYKREKESMVNLNSAIQSKDFLHHHMEEKVWEDRRVNLIWNRTFFPSDAWECVHISFFGPKIPTAAHWSLQREGGGKWERERERERVREREREMKWFVKRRGSATVWERCTGPFFLIWRAAESKDVIQLLYLILTYHRIGGHRFRDVKKERNKPKHNTLSLSLPLHSPGKRTFPVSSSTKIHLWKQNIRISNGYTWRHKSHPADHISIADV